MKRASTVIAAALLALQACATATAPDRRPLAIDYLATSKSTYLRFQLDETTVRVTSFDDSRGRCREWLKAEPCWKPSDLRASDMKISESELDSLRALIASSGFDDLGAVYGGTKPGYRHYVEKLLVRRGGASKEVVYERTPDAPEAPPALEKIRDRLLKLGRVHG